MANDYEAKIRVEEGRDLMSVLSAHFPTRNMVYLCTNLLNVCSASQLGSCERG